MNATKAMTLLAAVAVGLSAQALTLAVKDVKIAQRYPWNGLVDIDYTVECDDPDADVYVYPVGYDVDMNLSVPPRTLTGDGANGKAVKAGTHRMTWDMAKDMGENYNRAKFSMKVHAYAGAAPYMVIDLSAGSNAEKYEVSYMSDAPEDGWPDEYKTFKMVFKLIPPGTFMMGSPSSESGRCTGGTYTPDTDMYYRRRYFNDEVQHKVTLTQPFYCAIFEITDQQYNKIMGTTLSSSTGWPCSGSYMTYDNLRGNTLGQKWPEHQQVDATSVIGRLRSRTGITLDLPTEAQWEYACRAGSSTAYSWGTDSVRNINIQSNPMMEYYYWNVGTQSTSGYSKARVGSFPPNAWGLYDMHGNVAERCLDWHTPEVSPGAITDPKGREFAYGNYNGCQQARVIRGGSYRCYQEGCRSAMAMNSYYFNGGGADDAVGCRLVALPAAK